MSGGLTKVSSGISDSLQRMLDRSRGIVAFLNTTVYREYQNAQRKRWMTENASQGAKWEAIDPVYADYKRRRFASYPGGGSKTLIATGALQASVIGPGDGHRKIVTPSTFIIATTVSYASYVDEHRTFTEFSDEWKKNLDKKIMAYVGKGVN